MIRYSNSDLNNVDIDGVEINGHGDDGNKAMFRVTDTKNTRVPLAVYGGDNAYIQVQAVNTGTTSVNLKLKRGTEVFTIRCAAGSKAYFEGMNEYRFNNPVVLSDGNSATSDDRIKYGETLLTNALTTIKKLNPVSYRKAKSLDTPDSIDLRIEYGLVAQELYNNVPELRHVIHFQKDLPRNFVNGDLNGNCVEDIYARHYNNDGTFIENPEICSVNYNDIYVLNIKATQELLLKVESLEQTVTTLETNIVEQATEITKLKTENIEMKLIIDKLKTSNSFEEFKNNL